VTESKSILTFRGVRGSMPVSGADTTRHVGNTLCIDITAGGRSVVLIDGGTGIARLNQDLTSGKPTEYHVFLTHYHWDHIQGLLFFRPLFDPDCHFTFYGHQWDGMSSREAIEGALQPPWFPISIQETAAEKAYVTLEETKFELGDLTVTSAPLRHPQGVTAYRIDGPNRSVVIATDCERGELDADDRLRRLAAGADILVHDAQYSPEEYEEHYVGWGYSSWAHAAQAAKDSGVGQLVLVSHDPARTDDEIAAFVQRAAEDFPNTTAAYEGMSFDL
jgi:phosphoribosyl 1,2-cyclic phosphodiesterase